tara:strand:- start:6541 stop:6999 length:459 start_codon:yes stop_codon:yes gene_type:complete
MSGEKNITSFVKGLYNTIQKVGINKVINKLNELNMPGFSEYENEIKNYIIITTLKYYGYLLSEVRQPNIRGQKVEARTMCFIHLKKHLNLSHSQIATIFNRTNHSIVSNAITQFSKMNINHKHDKLFLENYSKINTNIKKFKNTLLIEQKEE